MHTLHYIAVEADNKQEAFDKVVIGLQPNEDGHRLGDWSDWHVVGGGRFSSNAHKENKANPMGGSYTNDPADVIGYASLKKIIKVTEGKGFNDDRNRAISTGERILNLSASPAYIAKNRYDMPATMPLLWSEFAKHLPSQK